MLRRMAVLATLAIVSSGCSVIGLRGPPQLRPGAPLPARAECDTHMVIPGFELFVASVSAGVVIGVAASRARLSGSEKELDFVVYFPLSLISAVSGASGLVGITRVQACRDFTEMISLAADTTAREPVRPITRRPTAADGRPRTDPARSCPGPSGGRPSTRSRTGTGGPLP